MALENQLGIHNPAELAKIHKFLFEVEIKVLLKDALTDQIVDREVYMKGIDVSYYYEGTSDVECTFISPQK
ncbi:MAG: hypothetical protein K2P39_10970 [Lachnospiraceae bacterium]|nr:hypothetical protein [Lachnospiraceae bacterium]